MNLDIVYLRSILNTKNDLSFVNSYIKTDFLSEGYRKIYEYICSIFSTYGEKPDIGHVEQLFGIDLKSAPIVESEHAKKLLRARFGYEKINKGFKESNEKFSSSPEKDLDAYLKEIMDLYLGVDKLVNVTTTSKCVNLLDPSLYNFEELSSGVVSNKSIDTPFNSLTERMGGLKPGDLITLAARPGQGKTFALLLFMIKAASQNKKCLLVTTEMSIEQMKNRFISLFGDIGISKPAKNKLTKEDVERISKRLFGIEPDAKIQAVEQGFSARVEDIEIDIIKNKPDFLCVDGFYLLKTKENHRNKFDRIAEIIDTMKMYALKYNIPVLITTQMNRPQSEYGQGKGKSKGHQSGGLERLAFSDNIGMVSDYVFFMENPYLATGKPIQNMMIISPKKMRQVFMANAYDNIPIVWDINELKFYEDLFWEHPDAIAEIGKKNGWAS